MARADDICRILAGINGHRNGVGAISGGNSGGHTLTGFDGDGEVGFQSRRVILRHQRQLQLVYALFSHGQTHQTATMLGHEINRIRRCHLRRDHKIPLVFTIFRIDKDKHLAIAGIFQNFFRGREVLLIGHLFYFTSVMRATYRASTSISKFTPCPTLKSPKVVWA